MPDAIGCVLSASAAGITEISFADIPVFPAADTDRTQPVESGIAPVAVINTPACSIAISAEIPEVLLSRILKEVSHA